MPCPRRYHLGRPRAQASLAGHASTWTRDHIRLLGSEYTSKPFDDGLVTGWGDFVAEAHDDVVRAAAF